MTRCLRWFACAALVVCIGLAAAASTEANETAASSASPTEQDLTDAGASGEWLLPNHDYASRRFSPLTQIRRDNVARLRLLCTYDFEDRNRFGANPLVHDGVLYVTSGDTTVALDAATCAVRWRHVWQGPGVASDPAARKTVTNAFKSRGAAIRDGKLVRPTSDSSLIALDLRSGRLLWSRTVALSSRQEFIVMAPLVHGNRVIVGIGIGEFSVRGWVGAFDLATGEPIWRFDTIPGDGQPGAETWSDAAIRSRGGGGVWVTPSLDARTGLLYVAVGNPVPDFHGDAREGSNLYTDSVVALDAQSGELKWHRQFVPHDLHDWDLTIAGPLIEGGETAPPSIIVGGKDGLLRSVDRATGRLLFETEITTRSNVEAAPTIEGVHACPGVFGGMQWSHPAYHPGLALVIAPAVDWCGVYRKAAELRQVPGQLFLGGSYTPDALADAKGWLTAIDARSGAVRWRHSASRPMLAGVTVTASDLVFTGELTGEFLALDAANGAVLYRHDTGTPLHAGIITYAKNGRQYVAVTSGTATSFWRAPSASSVVMVFGLPE